MTEYGTTLTLSEDYSIVVENTIKALRKQGFGVITEIDVKDKQKIDADFKRSIILGIFNPILSKKALDIEQEIGLFLPCYIIVHEIEEGKASKVVVINPGRILNMIENSQIERIMKEIKSRIQRVIVSLTGYSNH